MGQTGFGQWAATCEKKRVSGLRRLRARSRDTRTKRDAKGLEGRCMREAASVQEFEKGKLGLSDNVAVLTPCGRKVSFGRQKSSCFCAV